MNTKTWTLAEDLKADAFDGVALNLFDLYRARLGMGQRSIKGVTFTNCRLEGPVVMLVVSGCRFDAVNFNSKDGDTRKLVLHPASPTGVTGAIPVEDCQFLGVEFYGVGFTGSKAFTKQLLDLGTTQ